MRCGFAAGTATGDGPEALAGSDGPALIKGVVLPSARRGADRAQRFEQSSLRTFKTWAAGKRRRSFEDDAVRRGCRSMDFAPEDLRRVVDRVSLEDGE